MYLVCLSHDPPLYSDEVGQHLYDLKDIRKYLANKNTMIKAVVELDLTFYGNPPWANTAAWFLSKHSKCHIGIEDEYGKTYPVVEET